MPLPLRPPYSQVACCLAVPACILQYQQELDRQVQEKRDRKERERRERQEFEARKDREVQEFDYFHSRRGGGGGEPMRDADGNVRSFGLLVVSRVPR